MNTLTEINAAALNNPKQLILQAEQAYHQTVEAAVCEILKHQNCKIVLMAGPSASGKTTTAHILCDLMAEKGVQAAVVSLDNFYLLPEKMPLNAKGEPDFETVYSLDIPLIQQCFSQILQNGQTEIPVFNFHQKCRNPKGLQIDVSGNKILIVEGLHALNPVLTGSLPQDGLFKIYISVNQSVYAGESILLSSRQLRLCRRLSRDFIYRSSDAAFTLKLWSGVVEGEQKYLYCFKNHADVKLATFHAFEPCLFAGIVPKLLAHLTPENENYEYAMRTKKALEQFCVLPQELIPQSSLLREFIQGGKYEAVT